ncbi:MAG: HD domain-containing protein [Planctomycetia bacterium]|nr:HD domain-containing protein [Planctomycetia bacterium]
MTGAEPFQIAGREFVANKTLFSQTQLLSDLSDGQEADFFAQLTLKEEMKTRDGKPYFRVGFRDARREVAFPLWNDTPWFAECRDKWEVGGFFKLRAMYRQTQYGPQLDIRKIRPAVDEDRKDGFDPGAFQPSSRFDPEEMFGKLRSRASDHIQPPLLNLVLHILDKYKTPLLTLPAATRMHHAFRSGWLEHVLSVTETCVMLAEKYDALYPDLKPRLNKGLVVAGGILHDIGKLRELAEAPAGTEYTPAGYLVGHVLQGRDIVREAAAEVPLDDDTLLRLEHIVVAHQRLPEWGAPKPPMTPEALLVHYADDIDAKFQTFSQILAEDTSSGAVTSKQNALAQRVFKGALPPGKPK